MVQVRVEVPLGWKIAGWIVAFILAVIALFLVDSLGLPVFEYIGHFWPTILLAGTAAVIGKIVWRRKSRKGRPSKGRDKE